MFWQDYYTTRILQGSKIKFYMMVFQFINIKLSNPLMMSLKIEIHTKVITYNSSLYKFQSNSFQMSKSQHSLNVSLVHLKTCALPIISKYDTHSQKNHRASNYFYCYDNIVCYVHVSLVSSVPMDIPIYLFFFIYIIKYTKYQLWRHIFI